MQPSALSEWELMYNRSEEGSCVCSHRITESFYIKNNFTWEVAIVGCDCIKKLKTRDLNLWKQIVFAKSLSKKYEKRTCCFCCKYMASKDDRSDLAYCNKCIKEENTKPSNIYFVVMSKWCTRCEDKKVLPSERVTWCESCSETCFLCGVSDQRVKLRDGVCPSCRHPCKKCGEQVNRDRFSVRVCHRCLPFISPAVSPVVKKRRCTSCKTEHDGKYKLCNSCYWSDKREQEAFDMNRPCSACEKYLLRTQPSYHKQCWFCYRLAHLQDR